MLVTLYREPRAVLEEALASLAEQAYDLSLVRIVLVHEADDPIVTGYLDDVIAADTESWQLEGFAVERSDAAIHDGIGHDWPLDPQPETPWTKGGELPAWLGTEAFEDEEVLTVFDADTLVEPDLFALAVRDHVTGVQTTFEVTPKFVARLTTDANATSLRATPQN